MQHWEDTPFLLWFCGDLLWGISVSWILTKSSMFFFFRHPDFLVVIPFVGGWFRKLQQFQARCMLLPMHKQILEPQPHSSTSHQINKLHVQSTLPPPPRSCPESMGFFTIHMYFVVVFPFVGGWFRVLQQQFQAKYKHDACFYPVHKQILEPHPRSSTSHQINFTSIVFWPPRPVGAGGPLFQNQYK